MQMSGQLDDARNAADQVIHLQRLNRICSMNCSTIMVCFQESSHLCKIHSLSIPGKMKNYEFHYSNVKCFNCF